MRKYTVTLRVLCRWHFAPSVNAVTLMAFKFLLNMEVRLIHACDFYSNKNHEYDKTKTAVLYSKHKILNIPDLF